MSFGSIMLTMTTVGDFVTRNDGKKWTFIDRRANVPLFQIVFLDLKSQDAIIDFIFARKVQSF